MPKLQLSKSDDGTFEGRAQLRCQHYLLRDVGMLPPQLF